MSDVDISFGAQDQGVAAAARRLSAELAVAEKAGGRLSASQMGVKKSLEAVGKAAFGPVALLGRFGPMGASVAALGVSWMGLAHASAAYAKVDKETQHALDVTAAKAENMWAKLGHLAGGDVSGPLKTAKALIDDLLGADPELQAQFAAAEEKQARRRQDLALARDADEQNFLKTLWEEEDAYEKIIELHKVMKDAGVISGAQFGGLMRIDREAHERRQDRMMEERNRGEGQKARDQEEAERKAREAGDDQMRRAYELERADRRSLDLTVDEARIDELRAKGKDLEARKEELRLATKRKILEITEKEYATEEEKRRAIEAVESASEAQMKALTATPEERRRVTGAQVIASGMYYKGLERAVGNVSGEKKPIEDLKKSAKEQTDLLKRIEANTRAGAVLS